jgi:predicted NBD/HSP70 family sugar kinase
MTRPDPRFIDASSRFSAGHCLAVIRRHKDGVTRSELCELVGVRRSDVSDRVRDLVEHGYITVHARRPSTGGRPPDVLRLNSDRGVVLGATLGSTNIRVVGIDMAGVVLAEESHEVKLTTPVATRLKVVHSLLRNTLEQAGTGTRELMAIGIAAPGSVVPDASAGRWPLVEVCRQAHDYFAARYDAPIVVEHDACAAAFAESRHPRRKVADLLFLDVSASIQSALVRGGRIHRGTNRLGINLEHVMVAADTDVACACGNVGCVGAVAGGATLVERASRAGRPVKTVRDLARLAAAGNRAVNGLLDDAGRTIGGVVANAVRLLSPQVVVLGGELALSSPSLIAGVRDVVHDQVSPHVRVAGAALGPRADVFGAALLALESALAPAAVNLRLAAGSALTGATRRAG